MSFSFKDYPPKRVPVVKPLYDENPIEAMNRFKSLVNHWRRVDYGKIFYSLFVPPPRPPPGEKKNPKPD